VHGFPTRADPHREGLSTAHQFYATEVVRAPVTAQTQSDAMWTDEPGRALGITTADCAPLLIEDPVGRRVAAVHAGWRGAIAEIALRALETLAKQGTRMNDVRAVIGPCIRSCCYAVGEDLIERFEARFGKGLGTRRGASVYLDLPQAVRRALLEARVPAQQLGDVELCTHCDARFHSHRRDAERAGRQVSFIVCDWPRGERATQM